jgi:hypothetical protein
MMSIAALLRLKDSKKQQEAIHIKDTQRLVKERLKCFRFILPVAWHA